VQPERVDSLVQRVDFGEKPPPATPRCTATTKTGEPCRARPLVDSSFCVYHDPDYAEQHRQNSQAGGVASGVARQPLPLADPGALDLSDRAGVQAVIDFVLRLELCGKMPPSRSRPIVRLLGFAYRNFDRPARTGYYDAVIGAHDPATYRERRQALHDQMGELADSLHDDEFNRRMSAIADVGAKRQEFLKANDLFAPPQSSVRGPQSSHDWPNDWLAHG